MAAGELTGFAAADRQTAHLVVPRAEPAPRALRQEVKAAFLASELSMQPVVAWAVPTVEMAASAMKVARLVVA